MIQRSEGKSSIVLSLMLILSISLYGQNKTQEFLRMQEQIKKTDALRKLDSGVYLMDHGQYELANEKFIYALNNLRSVPSDLTFYFGKNSFYLGRYKQSIDWINKYIQLKGTNGQFSSDAVIILKQAEAELLKEKSEAIKKSEEVLSTGYDIDCGPSGKVTCPVCKGDHVVITRGPFNDQYKTCPYCSEHGLLTCDEYNKLLRGELKPKF
jgi:tetratricopeptide (TPR) repeat protein